MQKNSLVKAFLSMSVLLMSPSLHDVHEIKKKKDYVFHWVYVNLLSSYCMILDRKKGVIATWF